MVHHDLEIFLVGKINQLFGLRHVAGKRFFDENMLTAFESGFGQLIMRPDRSDHRDGVDVWRTNEFTIVRIRWDVGMRRLEPLARGRALVANSEYLAIFQAAQVSNDIRSPISVANNTELKHDNSLA